MQRDREAGKKSDAPVSTFDSFGRSGSDGSLYSSIYGGKDPFDDPFFTRSYGGLFRTDTFRSDSPGQLHHTSQLKRPVIKELESDSDEVLGEGEDADHGASWSNRNPLVEHPEDQANDNGKSTSNGREVLSYAANYDKAERPQPQTHSVSFRRVTYGGINGTYYSATTSRRMGSDGVTLEESKQADRTTGQASHKVSRGIHDKGHSVTRKLDSDGKVDTVQTLHNLGEDELAGFEQAWDDRRFFGSNSRMDFPGFSETGMARGGFWDPFRELSQRSRGQSFDQNLRKTTAVGDRPKKVVTINIE